MTEADYMADCEADDWDVSESEYYADGIDARLDVEDKEAYWKKVEQDRLEGNQDD